MWSDETIAPPGGKPLVLDGRYELEGPLGKGGMGAVWRARHLRLGSTVAVKLIDPRLVESAVMRSRFEREAQLAARLQSRHVVRVLDYGFHDERPYLVMELLQGETLGAYLRRGLPGIERTANLFAQLAAGVAAAHREGVVHRDLKPDNVFLEIDSSGGAPIAKLLDFGVAKDLSDARGLTATGATVGTLRYMSPEQIEGRTDVDGRADIWALGTIAFECLCGSSPFASDSLGALVRLICEGPSLVPSKVASVPPGFDGWFARATSRDRDDRFADASSAADALWLALDLEAPDRASVTDAGPAIDATKAGVDATAAAMNSSGSSSSSDASRSRSISRPDRYSIAVLPFTNLSGDSEQEYFAAGIIEDIVTALGRVPSIFVISSSSTARFRGREGDLSSVGRELHARFVVTGSVRRAGSRVRISAQLIEVETSAQVWADRFDGDLEDLFDLQDRISENVVGAIEPTLLKHESQLSSRKHPANLDAHDLYLQALPHVYANTSEDAARGLALLSRALELDPHHGPANGYAAWAYEQRHGRGSLDPADLQKAIHHARAALTATDDPIALSLGGFIMSFVGGDPGLGLAAIERACTLNPSSALANGFQALMMVIGSDSVTEALERANRALRLSPYDPMLHHWHAGRGLCLFRLERYAEARDAFAAATRANPRFDWNYLSLAFAQEAAGDHEAATRSVAEALAISPHLTVKLIAQQMPFFVDRAPRMVTALCAAGLPEG